MAGEDDEVANHREGEIDLFVRNQNRLQIAPDALDVDIAGKAQQARQKSQIALLHDAAGGGPL